MSLLVGYRLKPDFTEIEAAFLGYYKSVCPKEAIMKRRGHEKYSTTMDTYAEEKEQTAERMDTLLSELM